MYLILTFSFLSSLIYFIFWTLFLWVVLAVLNSLCNPDWLQTQQRATWLCLQSAKIAGLMQLPPTFNYIFIYLPVRLFAAYTDQGIVLCFSLNVAVLWMETMALRCWSHSAPWYWFLYCVLASPSLHLWDDNSITIIHGIISRDSITVI